MKNVVILLSMLVCGSFSYAQQNRSADWELDAHVTDGDTLCLSLTLHDTKEQLTSLMQGLTLSFLSQKKVLEFPSAHLVRAKLKRHPNEVKAMMRRDSIGGEVRPDLFPLVKALSDTTAALVDNVSMARKNIRSFGIMLDKERALLTYSAKLPVSEMGCTDSIAVVITSDPGKLYNKKEFTGRRLSRETSPVPNGLGEASMVKGDKNRTIRIQRTIILSDGSRCKICNIRP